MHLESFLTSALAPFYAHTAPFLHLALAMQIHATGSLETIRKTNDTGGLLHSLGNDLCQVAVEKDIQV